MTWHASIAIDFEDPVSNPLDVIAELLNHGWKTGGMYLPLGDDGMYNWEIVDHDEWKHAIEEMRRKVQKREDIGVILQHDSSDDIVGVQFVFVQEYRRMFANINGSTRVMLPGSGGVTDFSWYLSKIAPSLVALHLTFSRLECVDYP